MVGEERPKISPRESMNIIVVLLIGEVVGVLYEERGENFPDCFHRASSIILTNSSSVSSTGFPFMLLAFLAWATISGRSDFVTP